MNDHKEALRKWLRGKGFHPNDVACALEYYCKSYPPPSDQEVLDIAENAHKTAVDTVVQKLTGEPYLVKYEKVSDIKWVQMVAGAILAILFDMIGVGQWLLQIIK